VESDTDIARPTPEQSQDRHVLARLTFLRRVGDAVLFSMEDGNA